MLASFHVRAGAKQALQHVRGGLDLLVVPAVQESFVERGLMHIAVLVALDDEQMALVFFVVLRLDFYAFCHQRGGQALGTLRGILLVGQIEIRIDQQSLQYRRVDQPTQAVDDRFGQKILFRYLRQRFLA